MSKALLIVGGILNSLFFLLHLVLAYQINHLTQLAAPLRGLMEALSVGGVLFIIFFAFVSFFCQAELLQTRLGRTVLVLITALYLSRAVEEFILFTPSLLIFLSCTVTGLVYLALLVLSLRTPPHVAAERKIEEHELMHV